MVFPFLTSWYRNYYEESSSDDYSTEYSSSDGVSSDQRSDEIHEDTRSRNATVASSGEAHTSHSPKNYDGLSFTATSNLTFKHAILRNPARYSVETEEDDNDISESENESLHATDIDELRDDLQLFNPFTGKLESPNIDSNPFDDKHQPREEYIDPDIISAIGELPCAEHFVSIDTRLEETNREQETPSRVPKEDESLEPSSEPTPSTRPPRSSFRRRLSANLKRIFQRKSVASASTLEESVISDSSEEGSSSPKKNSNEIVSSSFSSRLGFRKVLSNQTDATSVNASLHEEEMESYISNDNNELNILRAKKFKYLCFDKEIRSWEKTGLMPSV